MAAPTLSNLLSQAAGEREGDYLILENAWVMVTITRVMTAQGLRWTLDEGTRREFANGIEAIDAALRILAEYEQGRVG